MEFGGAIEGVFVGLVLGVRGKTALLWDWLGAGLECLRDRSREDRGERGGEDDTPNDGDGQEEIRAIMDEER